MACDARVPRRPHVVAGRPDHQKSRGGLLHEALGHDKPAVGRAAYKADFLCGKWIAMPSLPPMRPLRVCFYFHANHNVMFRELSALICAIPLKSLSVSVKNSKRFV